MKKQANKKKQGGARKGSGPKTKPEGEKKVPFVLYYTENLINENGGVEKFREKIYKEFPQ